MRKFVLPIVILAVTFLCANQAAAMIGPAAGGDGVPPAADSGAAQPGGQPAAAIGKIPVPAFTILQIPGMRINYYPEGARMEIAGEDVTVELDMGGARASVNNMEMPMEVLREKKPMPSRGTGNTLVVIDPGHGGKDPGAIYGGVKEKDLNLDVARRLERLLEENNIKTCMTRTGDVYVSLYDRSEKANRLDADLFISIHHNAGKSSLSGTMTLYYPANGSFTGKDLAQIVQGELIKKLGTKNLGIISRPNLAVLRTTKMPAIIAEIGYLTNKSELDKLKSPSYRQKTAEALRDAVMKALEQKR